MKGLVFVFGRHVNASLRPRSLPFHFQRDFYLNLRLLRCVYQPSFFFILKYRLRGAWPSHFFIFHLSCTVSPGNNGALHYITRPLCIHAIQSDIQSGSDTPSHPRHYWQNNTLKKPSWAKKKGEVLYLRWRLTSICDKINQFGAPLSLLLGVSSLLSLFK